MTSQEFMVKQFNKSDGKERIQASIVKDGHGTIYSFGYHYPLIFRVAGHTFINDAGYSNSTNRHIYWAKRAVNYDFTAVQLNRNDAYVIARDFYDDKMKLEVLVRATAEAVARATEACDAKKRKDTWIFQCLAETLERAQASQKVVTDLMEAL